MLLNNWNRIVLSLIRGLDRKFRRLLSQRGKMDIIGFYLLVIRILLALLINSREVMGLGIELELLKTEEKQNTNH